MAKLIYALNQSLDGYVDHDKERFVPRPALFRHFIEDVREVSGMVCGRRMYQIMRYWDEDHAEWGAAEHEYAAAWRSQPRWVVSRSLKSVGLYATLVADEIDAHIRRLKAQFIAKIGAGDPDLAGALTHLNLVDEYRLYVHPVVLGGGKPFFWSSAVAPFSSERSSRRRRCSLDLRSCCAGANDYDTLNR